MTETDEAVIRFAIRVEKLLCEAVGRPWSPAGFSIETLVLELRSHATDARMELKRERAGWEKERAELLAKIAERDRKLEQMRDAARRLLSLVPDYVQ